MTLAEWKSKGQFIDYNGHPIFSIDEGEGEAILLIHGFPTASWDWWQMWESLTARYRVLCLDMIGFGFSAKPRKYPYSIVDQADLIEQLLSSKKVDGVKILCHDYGVTVTQELLARFNERISSKQEGVAISSICFLNGGLFPETHHPLLIQKVLMSPLGSIVAKLFTRKKLGKNFRKIFGPDTQPTEKELDTFWELITTNGGKNIVHLLIRYMKERKDNRSRWVGALEHAGIPLLLINGGLDPVSGQHMVKRYKELFPNRPVIELERIGHFPLVETPKVVLQHYLSFIQDT